MPGTQRSSTISSTGSYDVFTSDAAICSSIQGYVDVENVARFGSYLAEINKYLKDHPYLIEIIQDGFDLHDVIDGARKGFVAARYVGSLNLRVQDWGASGGASVLGVFVDRFGAMAKKDGIEVNEMALALTKVLLDIAGAGTATVASAFTGPVGILLLSVALINTFSDSLALGRMLMAVIEAK